MKKKNLRSGYAKQGQRLFLLSFGALIALGTLLLWIPGMYDGPKKLSLMDSLFTATSAVCVTGLAVKPISDFSFWGQLVILLLIQAGGLGIMTLSASIMMALGRGLSFGESLMVSNLNDKFSLRGTESLTRTVINYTFIAEGIGFVALLPGMWYSDGIGFWKGLWGALFLSVSSFCNSGMTTFPDSLVGINRGAQLPAALLAITGGLGVYVIHDIIQVAQRKQPRLRVHSKLVLCTTAALLLGGTLAIWGFCYDHETQKNSIDLFDAFCFAVTSRTCGWNTAPMDSLSYLATRFIMLLMLIGGSPGSTAGGIKTSTVALALAGIWSTLRGDQDTLVFKRRIPAGNVMRALTIIILFVLLSSIGALMLVVVEAEIEPVNTSFEAVSALTTTGLSLGGTTGKLSDAGWGKLMLVVFMFLGRVGPFTALLFLMGREKHGQLKYPEERVIIG